MKLLSVVVPCFNSESYMKKCIESLLTGGEEVEIIIVDDGSTDQTLDIATQYAKDYPRIIKVIHQENKGHGGALNTGIKNASGHYLKVVDSDDWIDTFAYVKVLEKLREFVQQSQAVDVLISNFIYEKKDAKKKKIMRYHKVFPQQQIFTWDEVKPFRNGQYVLMHSVIYRMEVLANSEMVLPENTFYVDNLFVYIPMQYVRTLYYLDVPFYRYYIGREDQSVNESIMIKRIDQQLRVNRLMIQQVDLTKIENRRLKAYLLHYLEIVTAVSSILLIRAGTKENLEKKRALWKDIKTTDAETYKKLRCGLPGSILKVPGRFGRTLSLIVYRISRRLFGFN